jgi:hypothetical protein
MSIVNASALLPIYPCSTALRSWHLLCSMLTCLTILFTALLPCPFYMHLLCYQSTCTHAICFALLTYIHFLSNYGLNCSALSQLICSTAHSTVNFPLALPYVHFSLELILQLPSCPHCRPHYSGVLTKSSKKIGKCATLGYPIGCLAEIPQVYLGKWP